MLNGRALKTFAFGVVGGIAGTLAMRYYWQAVEKLTGRDPRTETRDGDHALDDISVVGQHHEEGEPSTAAMGRELYEAAEHEAPDRITSQRLSQGVHWTYGMSQGVALDAFRAKIFDSALLGGLTYGAGMWLLGDEIAVPAMGLADGPTKFPLDQHLHRLGAHLVYGAAAAGVSGALHRAFD